MLKELWRYLQCLQQTEAKEVQPGYYHRQAEGVIDFIFIGSVIMLRNINLKPMFLLKGFILAII